MHGLDLSIYLLQMLGYTENKTKPCMYSDIFVEIVASSNS